jgi:hypothetical protein
MKFTLSLLKEANMGQRADLIKVIQAEVGTKESPANSNKVKYNHNNGQYWCGYFVDWCAAQVKLKMPSCVYTPSGVEGFKGKGLFANPETSKPMPGWVAFMNFPGGDKVDHVGWVIKDNGDGTVTTIEGNTTADGAKGSQSNGGEVCTKIRAYRANNKRKMAVTIIGFGTPKFKD